jgi:hypothetical protein
LGIRVNRADRLSRGRSFRLTMANKKRNISALPRPCYTPLDTLLASESLAKGAENTCTEVQVFHRWYRENEAKTGAKVEQVVTYVFSIIYKILM